VLRGALSPASPHVHYITHFRYPRHGGFFSYMRKLLPLENLHLGSEAVLIDPKARQVLFGDGTVAQYDALISSVPLPDLIAMIRGVPLDVLDASRRLACSTCVLVNLGVDREDLSSAHMTYFYDDDICFTRLCFPHMLSPSNAPAGCGCIQAEVYFSPKYRPLRDAPASLIDPVIQDLRRCGLLRDSDTVVSRSAELIRYANVIFDLDRPAALRTVHGYLDDIGVAYCGRHGDWGYMWTDESFRSGEKAAEKAISELVLAN
jgi:protoporphyrinogen oxidase